MQPVPRVHPVGDAELRALRRDVRLEVVELEVVQRAACCGAWSPGRGGSARGRPQTQVGGERSQCDGGVVEV